MKQLYVGTASNNILAFPIEDILNMKVSEFHGSGNVKELGKGSTQKKEEKGKSNQFRKESVYEEEKIGSDEYESDDSAE